MKTVLGSSAHSQTLPPNNTRYNSRAKACRISVDQFQSLMSFSLKSKDLFPSKMISMIITYLNIAEQCAIFQSKPKLDWPPIFLQAASCSPVKSVQSKVTLPPAFLITYWVLCSTWIVIIIIVKADKVVVVTLEGSSTESITFLVETGSSAKSTWVDFTWMNIRITYWLPEVLQLHKGK